MGENNKVYNDIVNFIGDFSDVDPGEIKPESRIRDDLKIDSLTMIMMVEEAESRFRISIPDSKLRSIRTIADLVDCVVNLS